MAPCSGEQQSQGRSRGTESATCFWEQAGVRGLNQWGFFKRGEWAHLGGYTALLLSFDLNGVCLFFHYEVFPTGLDFYPSAVGCSALGWELLPGELGVLQPWGPQDKAARPNLPTLLLCKRSEEPEEHHSAPVCLPWVNSCCVYAGEQDGFGSTAPFFLQKWVDFVAGLAAFLGTWILAFPLEEFVASKTLIALV